MQPEELILDKGEGREEKRMKITFIAVAQLIQAQEQQYL